MYNYSNSILYLWVYNIEKKSIPFVKIVEKSFKEQ
jgi:hypothetical protein